MQPNDHGPIYNNSAFPLLTSPASSKCIISLDLRFLHSGKMPEQQRPTASALIGIVREQKL